MEGIAAILADFRSKGIRLWSECGQLHYSAPKGSLTPGDIEGLRLARREIVAFLETSSGVNALELALQPRRRFDRAPLAFSQLFHLQFYRLLERPAMRQIVSVI